MSGFLVLMSRFGATGAAASSGNALSINSQALFINGQALKIN